MAIPRDTSAVIEIPGPWQHRYVAANGARFHLADTDPGGTHEDGLVLLLHGFPEFWWSWRAQLPVLAEAGYRAVAMDLRGYGGSDKTPRGYDPVTLAEDVAGVVKALGHRDAILVGHGWGGHVAWATAALHPEQVSALCTVSAPHPNRLLTGLRPRGRRMAAQHVLAMQLPWLPERRLARPGSGLLAKHLRSWSAPGSAFPDETTLRTYQDAMGLWPVAHCALEYHRWLFRSRIRADGRRFNALMRRWLALPVFVVFGDQDPALPTASYTGSGSRVTGSFTACPIEGAGHFPHEENAEVFNKRLLEWLPSLS